MKLIPQTSKVARIRMDFHIAKGFVGYTLNDKVEFLDKSSCRIVSVGARTGSISKVIDLAEDEEVIGIKAKAIDGKLFNLQFKIGRLATFKRDSNIIFN